MAIKLIANYSKRLGLPGYSSHQFEVSVESELSSMEDIRQETEKLYATLQTSVDTQIQAVGFVPDLNYGIASSDQPNTPAAIPGNDKNIIPWKCSDKQRELILDIITKSNMSKKSVNDLSIQRFGKNIPQLNKLEASSLIDELLEKSGKSNGKRQAASNRNNYSKHPYIHQT